MNYSEFLLNCHYFVFPFARLNYRGLLSWFKCDFFLLIQVMKCETLCSADLYNSFEYTVCSTSNAFFTRYLETSSFGIIIGSAASIAISIPASSSNWYFTLYFWCCNENLAPSAISCWTTCAGSGNFQKWKALRESSLWCFHIAELIIFFSPVLFLFSEPYMGQYHKQLSSFFCLGPGPNTYFF